MEIDVTIDVKNTSVRVTGAEESNLLRRISRRPLTVDGGMKAW